MNLPKIWLLDLWELTSIHEAEITRAVALWEYANTVSLVIELVSIKCNSQGFLSSLRYNDVNLSPGWGSPLDRGQRLGVSKWHFSVRHLVHYRGDGCAHNYIGSSLLPHPLSPLWEEWPKSQSRHVFISLQTESLIIPISFEHNSQQKSLKTLTNILNLACYCFKSVKTLITEQSVEDSIRQNCYFHIDYYWHLW